MGFLEKIKKLFGKKEEEQPADTINQNPAPTDDSGNTTDQNQSALQ
ncbi:MAG: hypothetical protein NTW06_04845 [Candidatus Falkowbacteria bacterium]|nr:hypothetical protein [Candidatus Falkowbacteria bacterium]